MAGFLAAELGLGEGARLLLLAVQASGAATSTITYAETRNRQQAAVAPGLVGPLHDVNLLCVNPDTLPRLVELSGPRLLHNRYNVGVWHWELEDLPQEQHGAFDLVHEVWAGSAFTQRAFQRATDKPVHCVPPPVIAPVPDTSYDRAYFGLPEHAYTFLFAFDHLSTLDRKNALGVVEAFRRAFAPGEGPRLVVKSINGDLRPHERRRLRAAAAEHPDVVLMEHYLSGAERVALMAVTDAYVSLHRSEGFGLTVAEAMALGKPVVVTGYSGTLDFATSETAMLVPYVPAPVPSGSTYPVGHLWADPDLDVAARRLRELVERPRAGQVLGRKGQRHVLREHGLEARAELVSDRLTEIRLRRSTWHDLEGNMDMSLRARALAHEARVWARSQPALRSAVVRARRAARSGPPPLAAATGVDVEERIERLEREVARLTALQSAVEVELDELRLSDRDAARPPV